VKGGGPKGCTPEKEAKAIKLYLEEPGIYVKDIAARLSVHPSTVRAWVKHVKNRKGRESLMPYRRRDADGYPLGG
jgi:transposase-like protein